jgi:hypothetical protein
MDKLKELAQLFENIEIDEKQENAIREFFTLFSESVESKVKTTLEEKIQALNEELESAQGSDNGKAQEAFELFEADAEKAFELFREDAEKAANLMLEDAKEEHAKQLAEALDKLYEDVEARATEDFKSSKEFATLVNVIKAVSPLVVSDDKKALLEEIEELKQKNEALQADNTGLSKKEIIASLVEGFSDEHKKTMVEFIEGSKTEDEIYERFNAIASFIESKSKGGDAEFEMPAKRRFKTKKEKKEEKKEEMSEGAPMVTSKTNEETNQIVNEDHIELVGANIPGLSKASKQGLAWMLHARQAT